MASATSMNFEVSTGHLPYDTIKKMERGEDIGIPVIAKGETIFILPVVKYDYDDDSTKSECGNLDFIMRSAQQNGADYLWLDSNVPYVPYFPVFNW